MGWPRRSFDPLRTALALTAAGLAGLAAVASVIDTEVVPFGVPAGILLALETVVDGGFGLVPGAPSWSADRRRAARVMAVPWAVLGMVAYGLASMRTACACAGLGHVPVLLLGVDATWWIALAWVSGPLLIAAASLSPWSWVRADGA